MIKYPNIIKCAYVWTNGDGSVGLTGNSAKIESECLLDLTQFDKKDLAWILIELREEIEVAFSHVWDDVAYVKFDFEMTED